MSYFYWMNYHKISPPPILANHVRYFWVLEGSASENDPFICRTCANGCPELIFHYKGTFNEFVSSNTLQPSFTSGIHGQSNQFNRFRITNSFGIFGVYLYPYALNALFGISAEEFRNKLPDLGSILTNNENWLSDEIIYAENNEKRVEIISKFLINRIVKFERPEIIYAVNEIITTDGRLNLQSLAYDCNLSVRQFERNFKHNTGFSPKLFSRIIRFNSIVSKKPASYDNLADVAYDFGYYDASHFIHDFKEFSGYSPTEYFSGAAKEMIV